MDSLDLQSLAQEDTLLSELTEDGEQTIRRNTPTSSKRPSMFHWDVANSIPWLRRHQYIGFGDTWLPIAYWLFTIGLLTYAWKTLQQIQNPALYGISNQNISCSNVFGSTLAVNLAASIIMAISDYFKTGLIAPTPQILQRWASTGKCNLGMDTWRGFKDTSWSKKILFLLLLFTSIPLHFLSNSLLINQRLVSNSYEVLMSTSFFDGQAFDISPLSMSINTEEAGQYLPSSSSKWPNDYRNVSDLDRSLKRLRDQTLTWNRLSPQDCVEAYSQGSYKNYRTLILFTNYSAPLQENSALAMGILPGFRLSSTASSVLALCPDAYLATYTRALQKIGPPFLDTHQPKPDPAFYLDPKEAAEIANSSTGLSPPEYGHNPRQDGPWPSPGSTPSRMGALLRGRITNTLEYFDLCYQYWDLRFRLSTNEYVRPRCDWQYCLAEPAALDKCDGMISPLVLYITVICLTIKLGAMTLALMIRCTSVVFVRWNDALSYIPADDEIFAELQPDDEKSDSRWGSAIWSFIYLSIFIYSFGLFSVSLDSVFRSPSSESDTTWYMKPITFHRALHVFYDINAYLEQNYIYHRVSIGEFRGFVHEDRGKIKGNRGGFLEKLKSLLDTFFGGVKGASIKRIKAAIIARLLAFRGLFKDVLKSLWILLPLRSAILHSYINALFNVQLKSIESLEVGRPPIPILFASVGVINAGWLVWVFEALMFLIIFPITFSIAVYYLAKLIRIGAGGPWKIEGPAS